MMGIGVVGALDGDFDGTDVEGDCEGLEVFGVLEGARDGALDGARDGCRVGELVTVLRHPHMNGCSVLHVDEKVFHQLPELTPFVVSSAVVPYHAPLPSAVVHELQLYPAPEGHPVGELAEKPDHGYTLNPAVTHGFMLVEAKSAQFVASCTEVFPAMPEYTRAVVEKETPPGPAVVVVKQYPG